MTRVAILALGPSAHAFRPEGYAAVYALPWDAEHAAKATHLFEMHPLPLLQIPGSGRNGDYLERLREMPNLYMQQAYDEVPNAREYPLQEVQDTLQSDYFGSSPAYMLGLAIHRAFAEIDLFGIDLADSIYDHQRPNLEWMIGFAQGQGTKVRVAPGGRLMTTRKYDRLGSMEVRYPVRYGYAPQVRRETWEDLEIR